MVVDQIKIDKAPTCLIIHKNDSKFVCFNIFVKNLRNPSKKPGLPHFIEHMIFDSSKDLPLGELDTQIETLGANTDGLTSYDFTLYRIVAKEESLEKTVSLMSHSIFNPLFTENDIEIEKKIIVDEFARKDFVNFDFVKNQIHAQMFGLNTEYGNPIEGDISIITRDDCILYHEINYFPENMLIVVSGNVENQKITDIVKKYFTSDKTTEQFIIPVDFEERNTGFEFENKDFYGIGFNFAPSYLSEESIVCTVLAQIIYAKTNRYVKEDFEKAKSKMYYSVQNWASPFVMVFKNDDIFSSKDLCKKALMEVIEGKIDNREIENAKNKIIQDFITKNQNPDSLTYQIGQLYIRYGFSMIGDFSSLINDVSKEDIALIAKKYIKQF